MKSIKVLSISILFTAMVAFPVAAQPGPQGEQRRLQLHEQLNLTEDQKSEFEAIHANAAKEQIDQRAAIGKARVELQQLLKAQDVRQSAIEQKLTEIGALESKLQSNRIDTWFKVNRLLTPDQQKLWKQSLEHRIGARSRSEMRSGRAHRRFDRPGPERRHPGSGNRR